MATSGATTMIVLATAATVAKWLAKARQVRVDLLTRSGGRKVFDPMRQVPLTGAPRVTAHTRMRAKALTMMVTTKSARPISMSALR